MSKIIEAIDNIEIGKILIDKDYPFAQVKVNSDKFSFDSIKRSRNWFIHFL